MFIILLSAKWVLASPKGRALQLISLNFSILIQALKLRYILLDKIKICDSEIIIQVIQLLSFRNDCHSPTDLPV
jgi:hypothetical protein